MAYGNNYKGYINTEACCLNCPFFYQTKEAQDAKDHTGECRKDPPTIQLITSGSTDLYSVEISKLVKPTYKIPATRFPLMNSNSYCGHHPDFFKEPTKVEVKNTPEIDIE